MAELTVFQKMTTSTESLENIVNREIGVKCCQPFAIRAYDALKKLKLKDEYAAKRAANTFLDSLQTLIQGGILSEDYDKLDLVERGGVISVSARVQALIRAFRRKGFTVIDTVVPVPKGDDIYFEEQYRDGVGIIYLLKDARRVLDRNITAERLANGYFSKYLCRLEIKDLTNNRTIMTTSEMSNDEVWRAHLSSEQGMFFSEWKEATDKEGKVVLNAYGQPKKYKYVHDGKEGRDIKYNKESIWYKWTGEMIKKTVIRRALKNIKESMPELASTIMAFDTDIVIEEKTKNKQSEKPKVINVEGLNMNVDLQKLTPEQKADADEVFEIYKQNPATAKLDAEKIKALYESGIKIRDIHNEYYAELVNIAKSKNLYSLIENIIKGVPYEKVEN